MSVLTLVTDPALLAAAAEPKILAGGIIGTLNDQTNQLTVLFKNVVALAILIAFFFIAQKARFATGAIVGGLLLCGAIFFAVNGGLEWVGSQFSTQVGAAPAAPVEQVWV